MLSIALRARGFRSCLRLSLCCALCWPLAAAPHRAGAQTSTDPANPSLTAHLSGLPFGVALNVISRSAGVACSLPPDLAAKLDPNQTYDIDITSGTFQDGLNMLLDQVNPPMGFHLEDGKYVLERAAGPRPNWGRKPAKKPARKPNVSMTAHDQPFEQAVTSLFERKADMHYRIDPSVTAFLDPITFSVENVTQDEALTQLLAAVPGQKTPLTFRVEKGTYVITTKGSNKSSGDKASGDKAGGDKASSGKADGDNTGTAAPRVEAIGLPSYHPAPRIKGVGVADARLSVPLRQLFQQTNADYVLMLPDSVAALPHVTFAMRDVPLEQAVVHLLRSAPADPILHLTLLNSSEPPPGVQPASAATSKGTSANAKTSDGKMAEAKPNFLYTVKPEVQSDPLPIAGYRFSFRFQNANLYDAL